MRRNVMIWVVLAVLFAAVSSYFYWPSGRGEETAPGASSASAPKEEHFIIVGSISQTIKEEVESAQPFADYLARHLRSLGVTSGRVAVATDIKKMGGLMKKQQVDIFFDSPYPVLEVSRISGAKPLLLRLKRGERTYRSLIFVRKDSGIESLGDLKEKFLSLEESFSTTGYMVPMSMLLQAGVAVKEYPDTKVPVAPGRVGYIFSKSDENTMFWVLNRRVAAGALDRRSFNKLGGKRRNELKIIQESIDIPRQILLHRSGLPPRWIAAIKKVLLKMHEDPNGKKALYEFNKTTKFVEFQTDPEAALRPVREMMDLVKKNAGKGA